MVWSGKDKEDSVRQYSGALIQYTTNVAFASTSCYRFSKIEPSELSRDRHISMPCMGREVQYYRTHLDDHEVRKEAMMILLIRESSQ